MSCAKDCGRQPIYAKFAQRPRWKRRRERGLQKKRGTGRCLALHFTADAESFVFGCVSGTPQLQCQHGCRYTAIKASSTSEMPRVPGLQFLVRKTHHSVRELCTSIIINLRIKAKLVKRLAFKIVEILHRITEFCAC